MQTKYDLIRLEILNALRRGEWQLGDQLPPLPELAARFQASRWATERALQLLINEGLLGRKPKKGTFVRFTSSDDLFRDAPIALVGVGPDVWMSGEYRGPMMSTFAAGLGERDWIFWQYRSLDHATERLRLFGTACIVALAPTMEKMPALEKLAQDGFQVLCLGARVNSTHLHSIATDNVQGVMLGLRYLQQLGHHRIAFIGTTTNSYDTRDRVEGFKQGVRVLGLDPSPDLLFCEDQPYNLRGLVDRALDRLLARPQPPTAIFTGGYSLTQPFVEAVSERGIAIPADLSVLAYDESTMLAHLATPLTVIRQPLAAVGQRAAQVLSLLSGNASSPIHLVLPAELVVRESCAPPNNRTWL